MSQEIIPGVHVNEIPGFPPSVAEVDSAVPAFIGYTEKAKELVNGDLDFIPQRIVSLREFEDFYGFFSGAGTFVLYHAIQLFFANGGSGCYIVSIGDYNQAIQQPDFVRGLDAISTKDEPTLLVFPDAVNLPGTGLYEVQRAALKQAADLGDRFCILDLKFAATKEDHTGIVNEFRNNIGIANLKFGAAYTPWLVTGSLGLPPSAAVAGQYCSVDSTRGVWKAPANVRLNMVNEVAYPINHNEQDELNLDVKGGRSINAIREFTGKGILIWGTRTLAGNDNEWRYVPVRRFFNMIEESVKKACLSFVFEPNDAATWGKAKTLVENYLQIKWRQGALAGVTPHTAYFVKVGLGETMTGSDILEGRMIVEIGMAPIRPAEFIILRFSQKMHGN
ncbi:MAG: phage tail sheath family protein [Ferruginibacter sp.]|nr:phage tail sheath family protein [Chitinophagaceae bacterium]